MFPIKNEIGNHLQFHNIRFYQLDATTSTMSSQQTPRIIHLPKIRMMSRGGRIGSGIRITNVKSIKPPDPDKMKQLEESKLREQVQKEIASRSRVCANKTYECTLPVLTGRQHCIEHILQDPNAPYRQCVHTYSGGERCPAPAPAENRDHRDQGLCFEHARAALHARIRSAAPPPPVTTTETLLNQLGHYVRPERARTTSCASSVSVVSDPADQDVALPHAVDPFKQIDATAINSAYSASIMEYASASDSDGDSVTLGPEGNCRAGAEDDESGAEDAPCEDEPLWRAGVYTAEEVVSQAKEALKSLQSAYIRQMDRLRQLLQTARLQYLRSLKSEKEQYCSINAQARSGPLTVRERRQLRKLKAYAGHRRRHAVDAVLARKLHRKRAKVNEIPSNRPMPSQGRCTFTEGGVRCSTRVLPASKHCFKHILHDRHQILYYPCEDARGGVACREPCARLPLPSAACRYHTDPPLYTVFTLKKDDTDSESDSHSSSEGFQTEDGGDHSMEDGARSDVVVDLVPPPPQQYE